MCVRSTTGTDEDGMTEVLLELLPESADCNLPVLGDVGCSEFVGKSLTVVMVGAKAKGICRHLALTCHCGIAVTWEELQIVLLLWYWYLWWYQW